MALYNKFKAATRRGFTLVELMIVVVIIGILASLAIYGVQRYVANSKSAEARMALGRMSKDATSAFQAEMLGAGVITPGSSAAISRRLCGSAKASVPAGASLTVSAGVATITLGGDAQTKIKASKYQSKEAEWVHPPAEQPAHNGWSCLKFSMSDPQYYAYNYTGTPATQGAVPTAAQAGDKFLAQAVGDLDGDGTGSAFWLEGEVTNDNNQLVLLVAPTIGEQDPTE